MVYDASVVEAYRDFADKFHLARLQLLWAVIGLGGMVVLSWIPVSAWKRIGRGAFLVSMFLLLLVLIPNIGVKTMGARRWLALGALSFQPSELIKLTLIFYLASLFEKRANFAQVVLVLSVVVGLIMLQPDLGTAIVVAVIASLMYFFAGAPWKSFFLLASAGLALGTILIISSPYRRERVATFLNPAQDPLGASYHIRQILIALGSGGIFGAGLGQSRQKYEYIPEVATDSIFAIIAEETGFVGASAMIGAFVVYLFTAFSIAKTTTDRYAKLLAGGIASWIGSQTILNLGTMVALLPLTGVPLPFISYGGSSLIVVLGASGILLSISRNR